MSKRKGVAGASSNRPPSESLRHTKKEKYAHLRARGARQIVASKACKICRNTAGRWDKDSAVKARIDFLVNQNLADRRDENKGECRRITIDRNDIIMGFADIARDPLQSATARVAAWSKLADIFMLVPRSARDIKEFYGWTEEELIEYSASNGEFIPDRFKPYIGTGEPDDPLEEAILRKKQNLTN